MAEGKLVRFEVMAHKAKTCVWNAVEHERGVVLGNIAWWNEGRRYVFSPSWHLVFDERCLREIADFIEGQNKEQRGKRS